MFKTDISRDYFGMERRILKCFGISLDGNEGLGYKIYSFLFLSFVPYTYTVLAVRELFKPQKFEDICIMLVYTPAMVLALSKVSVMLFNRIKLGKLLDKLQDGIFKPNKERGGTIEENLIKNCLAFHNLQRMFYFSMVTISVVGTIINSTIIKRVRSNDYRDWDLAFGQFSVLNVTYSPNFEIIAIYQDTVFIFCGLTFICSDLMFAGILAHLTVQFKILQNNIRGIINRKFNLMIKENVSLYNSNIKLNSNIIPKSYLYDALKEMVLHHLAIIDVAKEVEDIYNILLLILYTGNTIILCCGLYMCTVFQLTDNKMIIFISGVTAISFQLFVICYWCDQATHQSLTIGEAVFETDFIGSDLNFQKQLCFIIRRSLKPSLFTAGKFFGISLVSFLRIMQASYSFFMVLRRKN